jgi:hypothetical protein
MKILIVFLFLFLSLSDGREIIGNSALLKESAIPTALVGMNVTWSFTSGINVTNVTIIVKRLDAGEWAAFGCGEHVAMVNIIESFSLRKLIFIFRVKLMCLCVKDLLMIQLL